MLTSSDSLPLLRTYLRVVGAALLAQGVLTLAFLAVSDVGARWTHGFLNHDARHGVLHVVWGLALLTLASRGDRPRGLVAGAIAFGVFYFALGVLGIVTHNPFGLRLGTGENGFHLIVGSSTLAVAGWAIRGAKSPAGSDLRAGLNNG